jgi:hypothetical protein
MKKLQSPQKHLIILTVIYLSISSCLLVSPPRQDITYRREEYYSFNPETIHKDITNNQENLFVSLNGTPSPEGGVYTKVTWNENYYYEIGKAFKTILEGDASKEWVFRYASFSLDCNEVKYGPQNALLIFDKTEKVNNINILVEQRITIIPQEGLIYILETEYSPNLDYFFPAIKTDAKVSILDALSISEAAGGFQKRNELENNCIIDIALTGASNKWKISYQKVLSEFKIEVNIKTGDVERIEMKEQ